jgi:hypothetical protein
MISANLEYRWPNQMIALLPSLEQVLSTVRDFEFDGASLVTVYPAGQELITFLKKQGEKIRSCKLKKVHRDCAAIVRE